MLRIRREGRRVTNHDKSHFQPFSKHVTYVTHVTYFIISMFDSFQFFCERNLDSQGLGTCSCFLHLFMFHRVKAKR